MSGLRNRGSWQMPGGKMPREPMFNLPTPIMVLGGVMLFIHLAQSFVLSRQDWQDILLTFAFIPIRYTADLPVGLSFPGGLAGDIWTFVSYAFLHGSWMHLLLNLVWMAVFATLVLRRIGTKNFAIFFVVTAAAGALVHLLLHSDSASPLIGVSAVLSGAMAATARFAFDRSGFGGFGDLQRAHYGPCLSLAELWDHPQARMFLILWLALNLIFGLGLFSGGGSIAWEAHLGGFFAGLFLFPYIDPFTPTSKRPKPPKNSGSDKKSDHLHVIK